jgi:hypothetical protein
VATEPGVGALVVGWYRNAKVYRDWQPPPSGSARRHSETDCGYYVTASEEDAILLPLHERVFPIPQKGKGEFGQSNIWYANDPAQHRHCGSTFCDTLDRDDYRTSCGPKVPPLANPIRFFVNGSRGLRSKRQWLTSLASCIASSRSRGTTSAGI